MIIKKHKNKNNYIISNGIFVRDLTKQDIVPIDLNEMSSKTDYSLFIENECNILSQKLMNIDHDENIYHPKILIVSDGYDFKNKHKMLANLPKDVTIIATNGVLKRWSLVGAQAEAKKAINYYVVNNPYRECLGYLPTLHRYYPKCIASSRTNPEFLKNYQGMKYIYSPVENEFYSSLERQALYKIDDYRNSICASLSLAYRFKAQKIMLFCCDDSFEDQRPVAIQLENKLWCYPQQQISHDVIDTMCYWLRLKNIEITNYSSGGKYINAKYINTEDDIARYFEDDE